VTLASSSFDSFSQNGEDVVLWRALQGITNGRYIEVGANDPVVFSVSRAFYDRGWSGITVEPDPEFARMQREQRPRDLLIEAAITARDGDTITFHVVDGTGLSTVYDDLVKVHAQAGFQHHDVAVPTRRLDRILEEAGWSGRDIHFMSVDTEGSEREVLESIDLSAWRPWILVIEATVPLSTESSYAQWEDIVTKAGYQFCLFDGLSRWYVADEHRASLQPALSYAASVLDDYSTRRMRQDAERIGQLQGAINDLTTDTIRWRTEALTRWAGIVADKMLVANVRAALEATQHQLHELQQAHLELQHAHHELNQLHHKLSQDNAGTHQLLAELHDSTSWRVTKPLRSTVGRIDRLRHRR
jgi:FkbM family methyltransferase